MGLLDRWRSRKAKRNPKLEAAPAPAPSKIAEAVASLPRAAKKADRMAVRRQYRSRPFRGIMDSRQREILANMTMTRNMADLERQAEEDALYGAGG